MRRITLALLVAVVLSTLASGVAFGVRTVAPLGVPPGTPVHMHTHPDNGIVSAVRTAAMRVGLGPVEAVGFENNCSPMAHRVLVCRDRSLERPGQPTATRVGAGWCVVRLEPTIGPGPSAVRLVTAALEQCLAT